MPVLLLIDAHSGVPAYRQLVDQVKFHVAAGNLEAGEEMPSTRALSVQLALNPMTISKAYSLLERDGFLDRRRGQALTVAARSPQQQQRLRDEALRQQLAQAATTTRQLGISTEDALRLFRTLLETPQP